MFYIYIYTPFLTMDISLFKSFVLLAIAGRHKFGDALVPHHCVAFNLVGRAMAVSRRFHWFGSPTVRGRTVRRFDSLKLGSPHAPRHFEIFCRKES